MFEIHVNKKKKRSKLGFRVKNYPLQNTLSTKKKKNCYSKKQKNTSTTGSVLTDESDCVSGSKIHAIWDFFVRDTKRGMAFCKVCHVWRVCKSSNYISNLLSHLKVKDEAHKLAYMEYVKKKEKEKQFRMKTLSRDFLLFQGDHFLV